MSQTQSYDYLTTAVHNEYLHIAGCNPTSPKVLVTFEAEEQLPSQPTLEHVDDVSTTQLGTLLINADPPWVYRNVDGC